MKCKDIPDKPILEFIDRVERREISHSYEYQGRTETFFPGQASTWIGSGVGVHHGMPLKEQTPNKLIFAKMRSLIDKGLVDGCACGCRGDFTLTDKGRELIVNSHSGVISND